jgi:predicted TIM-barrel fold metal-dependent hydrolase
MQTEREEAMQKIDVEAHFWTDEFVAYLRARDETPRSEVVDDATRRLYYDGSTPDLVLTHGAFLEHNLLDLTERRLQHMDENDVTVQLLSLSGPSVEQFAPQDALAHARAANDVLGDLVARHPDRFVGLATLAPDLAEESAAELERCVEQLGFRGANIMSHVGDSYLDEPRFDPIFETAARLGVPINLHPTVPHASMIKPYLGYGWALPAPGLGFGHETAVHTMRLIYSGLFDRHPTLQMMLGHFGEALTFWFYRIDADFTRPWLDPKHRPRIDRRPSEYLKDNFWFNCSGNFVNSALACTALEVGFDRILFASDYPWETIEDASDFIDSAPMSDADRVKVYRTNAERLFGLGAGEESGAVTAGARGSHA